MKLEISFQPKDIYAIPSFRPRHKCLFVGSGDSYAAGLAAQYASNNRSMCCNPLDLVRNPAIAKGRVVYMISISGRTQQNIKAAKSAASRGLSTVAVTSSSDAPLARACNRLIKLKYRTSSTSTSGTVSFSTSLVTCLSLAAKVETPKRLDLMFGRARKEARAVASRLTGVKGSYFVLGHGILFPIALYGALKFNEVLGVKANAYHTEEFCHSPIFSARHNDGIVIMGHKDDVVSTRLARRLDFEGFRFTSHVTIPETEVVSSALHSTFFLQLLVLNLAEMHGAKECYFLRNRDLLKVSSDLIYG